MKTTSILAGFLFIFALLIFPTPTNAVHSVDKNNSNAHQTSKSKKQKLKQRQSVIQKWLTKRLVRKLKKAKKEKTIAKQSQRGLAFGLISLLSLGVFFLGAFSGIGFLTLSGFLAAPIFAIIALVKGSSSLKKIKASNHPEQYSTSRKKAIWAIVLSCISLLIALLFLWVIIFYISYL